ncbi:hypothetical protein PPL_10274 [Heterostelium album PN500]|uniref:Endoglucanase n=1 Tax=Heterostelium pallidum (strain ATCC 26659 / Pp 5 / PN500) TaxID=670386 RepID=D3BQT6_HETP5|nr:hypothetical protein PPL_10274 [Heterostelium album PN500]EFA76506.1 hypothetical protein PPL_10274 [Heterostelium album PN500]|eukprot:XP_020428638.1 hypothetical protein PPL_10274 [Heterostelium album PN500]
MLKISRSSSIFIFMLLYHTSTNVQFINGQRPTTFEPLTSSDYCETLQYALLFYKYNRAGELPNNFEIPWRGNSVPQDGDFCNGYFDAGDTVKFVLPMASAMTMLSFSFLEFERNVEACGLTELFLDDIRHGTDWLMVAHRSPNEMVAQIGNAKSDHEIWVPPELNNLERPVYWLNPETPGTEVAMEASAALAAASIVYRTRDAGYSEKLLQHSKQLHEFAYKYQGNYSEALPLTERGYYLSTSGYNDEIVWATIWLYRATGDKKYFDDAKSYYKLYGIGPTSRTNVSMSWDQKSPGSSLLMAKLTNEPEYHGDIEGYFDNWLPGGVISKTYGGLAHYDDWGSCRYVANTAFLASVYGDSRYTGFTKQQINYLLGDNPQHQSYVVGIGPNFPGALVGGPYLNGSYSDNRLDFFENEVALDYNAGFVGALAYLVNPKVGDALTIRRPTPAKDLHPKLWETDTWLNNEAHQYLSTPASPVYIPAATTPPPGMPSTTLPGTYPPTSTAHPSTPTTTDNLPPTTTSYSTSSILNPTTIRNILIGLLLIIIL